MNNIRVFEEKDIENIANMVSFFRVELASFKGITRKPNIDFAKEEVKDYIKCEYPIFVAENEENKITGYVVCRIDNDVVWVESLYVLPEYRRIGVASLLFDEAEKLANRFKGDTVYNWIHPNNEKMINFLKRKGYDVLNLIEIRKPYKGETNMQKIKVNNHEFNY